MEAFEIIASYAAIDPATVVIISVDTHVALNAEFGSGGDDDFCVVADSIFFNAINNFLKINLFVLYYFSRVTIHE
jgi:hypothetical protein